LLALGGDRTFLAGVATLADLDREASKLGLIKKRKKKKKKKKKKRAKTPMMYFSF
jgi:hypothetical protein